MVTTTEIALRAERDLLALLTEIDDLSAVAEEWPATLDGERASIALDCDHLMATYLKELNGYWRAGQLSAEQEARYAVVRRKLREAMPLIERLDFYRPPVPLDE